MEWPSRNVPRGGIFNNAKVNYSPETREFVKTLLNESKMSIYQRDKVNYALRNGQPLNPLATKTPKQRRASDKVVIQTRDSRRRSLDTIRKSGAYERDSYRPVLPLVDRDKAKESLSNLMAYGKHGVEAQKNKTEPQQQPKRELNRYELLKQEIKEREEWLEEMEQLGEGAKYRHLIKMQILSRLEEIDKLAVQE